MKKLVLVQASRPLAIEKVVVMVPMVALVSNFSYATPMSVDTSSPPLLSWPPTTWNVVA